MMQGLPVSASVVAPFARLARLLVSWRLLRFVAPAYILLMLVGWGVLLSMWLGGRNGRDSSGVVLGPDFTAFYTGGWLIRHGDYVGLYDLERQASVQRSILPDYQGVSAYLNPPHYAMLLVPLSALPYSVAFALWTVLMIAAFIGAVALLRLIVPALGGSHAGILTAVVLLSPPVYYAISAGQNTGITLLLHAAILVVLVRRRDVLAGALIALGMLKPQLFVGLMPLLLLGGHWRALAGFSAVSAMISMSMLFAGSFVLLDRWIAVLGSDLYHAEIVRQVTKMFSWQSFFTLLLGSSSVATMLGWGAALLVFAWLCYLWWRQIGDLSLRYAVTVLGLMVTSPHLFVYDLGLLLLPGLVLTDRLLHTQSNSWLWLRLSLLALYLASLFAAQPDLHVGVVVVPLLTAIAWGAIKLGSVPVPLQQSTDADLAKRSLAF